jgi:hypothetical protein
MRAFIGIQTGNTVKTLSVCRRRNAQAEGKLDSIFVIRAEHIAWVWLTIDVITLMCSTAHLPAAIGGDGELTIKFTVNVFTEVYISSNNSTNDSIPVNSSTVFPKADFGTPENAVVLLFLFAYSRLYEGNY